MTSLDKLVEDARAALKRNDAAAAGQLAQQALALDPGCAPALHIAGVAAARLGHLRIASDLLRRAHTADRTNVQFLHDLGEFYYRTGELGLAANTLERAVALQPGRADLPVKLGFVHLKRGRFDDAIAMIHKALAQSDAPVSELAKLAESIRTSRPALASALHAAGLVEARAGRAEQALQLLRKAVLADPASVTFWYDLAQLCFLLNQQSAAADALSRAIELAPARSDLYVKLALVRLRQRQLDEAESLLRQALSKDSGSLDARANLANLLTSEHDDAESLDEARQLFQQCLAAAPGDARLHSGYGNLLARLDRVEDATSSYERALALNPGNVEVLVNLAQLLQTHGRYTEAEANFRQAIARQPNYAAAHRGLGHILLAQGRFSEGWREYHHRFFVDAAMGRLKVRPFDQPWWSGQPLAGKRLLAWAEQGVGEEIMYGSLLPELVDEAAQVIMECDPRLVPLFARSFPTASVVPRQTPPDPRTGATGIDFQCAFGSIAGARRPSFESFPARISYLIADRAMGDAAHAWLDQFGDRIKVGISWFSNNRQMGNRKSTALQLWAPLLRRPDIAAVDLQYGDTEQQRFALERQSGVVVHRHPEIDQLSDLDGFAALTNSLDLVITISNTTAHMAAALGRPCWVLLHDVPFWHWFIDRDDSPWHPSVRLFRQTKPGDWSDVFSRVEAAFAEWARTKTRQA